MNLTRSISEGKSLFKEGVKSENADKERGVHKAILMGLRRLNKVTSCKGWNRFGTPRNMNPCFLELAQLIRRDGRDSGDQAHTVKKLCVLDVPYLEE